MSVTQIRTHSYSLNLADEVKKGMFEKARKGENIGKAAYGYALENSCLVPSAEESRIVKLIFELYQTGSISSVTRHLNKNNIPTRAKGNWTQTTIRYILENPVYVGIIRYNYRKKGRKKFQNDESEWIISQGSHPHIIPLELFKNTQEKLRLGDKFWQRSYNDKHIRHWAQHLVKCELCGRMMTINSCGKGKYNAYRCSGAALGICQGKALSARKLDIILFNRLYDDLRNSDMLTVEYICNSTDTTELDMLNGQLKKLNTKYDLIKRSYLAQVDTLEEYKKNKEQLQKEEAEILQSIEKMVSKKELENATPIQFENFISILESADLSVEEKNSAAKQFIREIRLDLIKRTMRIVYFFG